MGCDIHGVVEKKVGKKWVTLRTLSHIHAGYADKDGYRFQSPLALSRNYTRFAALAGVRGDGPEAKGFPKNASDTARLLFEEEGDHTPSWLPLDEAAKIFLKTERDNLTDWETKYPIYTYFGVEAENNMKDYRLVFWFDS